MLFCEITKVVTEVSFTKMDTRKKEKLRNFILLQSVYKALLAIKDKI